MKLPPLQTALFKAANLLSSLGMTVPKYSRNSSGYSRSARVGVGEDDTLLRQVVFQAAVHDFRFVLRLHAGEVLLLGFWNAESVVRLADVVGNVVPARFLPVAGADVVEDVLKVEVFEPTAPLGHRLPEEDVERIETELPHPFRLVLQLADLRNDLAIDALAALEDVLVGRIVKPVFVVADADVGLEHRVRCHCLHL